MVDRTDPDNDAEAFSEGRHNVASGSTRPAEVFAAAGTPAGTAPPSDNESAPTPASPEAIKPAPMPSDPAAPPSSNNSSSFFGAALKPVLEKACDGRLRDLRWFRTDWQRGGALTGYGMYRNGDGREHGVVVKLPVPPIERFWLTQLQGEGGIVPRVYAHGENLGGYDFAWVVMERLPHGPLGSAWGPEAVDLVVDAACRFYAHAADVPVRHPKNGHKDWPAVLKQSRDSISNHTTHRQRWKDALKKADKRLPAWLEVWDARSTDNWCHGDLHLGNAMSRTPAPQGPALLLDFARSRPGHWVEDAVYFESLFWACRERLGDRRLCSMIARGRKARGLASDDNWAELAGIRRALLALSAPALSHEAADTAWWDACLEQLERV